MENSYIDNMTDPLRIKGDFRIARCCDPIPPDEIRGFLKPDSGLISVHKSGCGNLRSIQPERLVKLKWEEILVEDDERALVHDPDFKLLDATDFKILKHHAEMGVDYAAVVAKSLGIDRATVFERHKKLRDLGLLIRVQPKMIQYRKGIVKNKWIKHRNHTYYEITEKGLKFLQTENGNIR
jgi:hypothetical protein